MRTKEKRVKRCLACKGKQASHKCYGSWLEVREVQKCQPKT